MDPILHLVERSSGIIDPTSGSTDMSGVDYSSSASTYIVTAGPLGVRENVRLV